MRVMPIRILTVGGSNGSNGAHVKLRPAASLWRGDGVSVTHVLTTRDLYAIIDDADWPLIQPYRWYAHRGRSTWYAASRDANGQRIYMHRVITKAVRGMVVDHEDGDGMHNRRKNLTVCGFDANAHKDAPTTASSGFRGVRAEGRRWRARIASGGVLQHIGTFDTAQDAARAYDERAIEIYGKFAWTNFDYGIRDATLTAEDIPF